MLVVPHHKLSIIHNWCHKNVSPRRYYFHNQFGGEGWEFKLTHIKGTESIRWQLTFDDPKLETYVILKFI